jgi:hypothetical protein
VASKRLDKKEQSQNPAVNMDMVTKSRKRSRKTSDLLAITLPEDQKRKARERIHEHDLAKFEIVGIEVKGVPSVRVINQPITPPPPPPPTPKPPPPPRPPRPSN